jgi:hypothetical protein
LETYRIAFALLRKRDNRLGKRLGSAVTGIAG